MADINIRGTFLLTKACLPHLRKSANAARADDRPAAQHEPVLAGPASELHAVQVRHDAVVAGLGRRVPPNAGIAFNCLWPETYIATAAVTNLAEATISRRRRAARRSWPTPPSQILGRPAREVTGQCLIDADVLRDAGVTDLSRYGGGEQPIRDLFLDAPPS